MDRMNGNNSTCKNDDNGYHWEKMDKDDLELTVGRDSSVLWEIPI